MDSDIETRIWNLKSLADGLDKRASWFEENGFPNHAKAHREEAAVHRGLASEMDAKHGAKPC